MPPSQPETLGFCGRFVLGECRLSWHSQYANKVGVYPADWLPASKTVWHAASDGAYDFPEPIVAPGDFFGLPLGGLITFFFAPPQSGVFTPQSHVLLSFIKSANRLNVTHIITQEEIDDAAANNGIATVDIGEYILEAIAVTDLPQVIVQELSQGDIDDLKDSGENPDDRAFRKLFEQNIPSSQNRLAGIDINTLGIEYRLDNGSNKANDALKLAGTGDLKNAFYKDGSSRKLKIDLTKVTTTPPTDPGDPAPPVYPPGSLQADRRAPKAGDTIFLTYIAAVEHYIRQSVNVLWEMQAISLPPVCFGFPTKVKAIHFRFYEWQIKDDSWTRENPVFKKIGGWRAVESFGMPVNFVAPIGEFVDVGGGLSGRSTKEIGDFVMGDDPGSQSRTLRYMKLVKQTNDPTEIPSITESDLRSFIDGSDSPAEGEVEVKLNQFFSGGNYHSNSGINGNNTAYKLSSWFTNFVDAHHNAFDARQHVFYNVHPLALHKRDVDKVGIEKRLAQALTVDIDAGRETSFPFMDDPHVNNPFSSNGSLESLSASNTLFEPVQPVTPYSTANADVSCGVGAGVLLFQPIGQADVLAAFSVNSNVITEPFDVGTKVFVERNFTFGQKGKTFIALEGAPGQGKGSVSCIADPSKFFDFVSHVDKDGFLMFNPFYDGYVTEGLSNLDYRPDLEAPPLEITDPTTDQFEPLLSYNGILGDIPGFRPGVRIGVSFFSDVQSLKYKTTDSAALKSRVTILDDSQISELLPDTSQNDKIVFPAESGYHGVTEIEYEYTGDTIEAILLFKNGSDIEGSVDSVIIKETNTKELLRIDHRWMKGSSIELVGKGVSNISLHSATIIQMQTDKANDFLADIEDENEEALLTKRGLLCSTNVVSMGEDRQSRLFIFMSDDHNGISCLRSHNFGDAWEYHYGIVEQIVNNDAKFPFVVNARDENKCFLFFSLMDKIFCKYIDYSLFQTDDAMIVERFESDILEPASEDLPHPREKLSSYTQEGIQLRRRVAAYLAAGRLNDEALLNLIGRDQDSGNPDPFEDRIIEVKDENGNLTSEIQSVRKVPLAIGNSSGFANTDVPTQFFSAIRTHNGELRLFFMGLPEGFSVGEDQLQCHFSTDNGNNWYDYWEYIDNGYNRFRVYSDTKNQFIDQSVSGDEPTELDSNQTQSENPPSFGINLHWSRLKRHKKDKENFDVLGESEIIDIDAPYVFYDRQTKNVFFFYIYKECLLCKISADDIFESNAGTAENWRKDGASGKKEGGMAKVKEIIEQSRSYFVDGDLSNDTIREEIHMYVETSVSPAQQMVEGNIVFQRQEGIDNFGKDRAIVPHRVCAYSTAQGATRIFYKHAASNNLKAAIWNGGSWIVEDFLKEKDKVDKFVLEESDRGIPVTGEFVGVGI